MMEQPKFKTKKELDEQLVRAESLIDNKIEPESIREKLLSMSLEDIKNNYPEQYRTYLLILKTEAQILNFPDIDKTAGKPKISLLPTGARNSSAFKVDFGNEAHVIKSLESFPEKSIAMKASELGIGPKQYQTKEGFLHEEFIDGTPLLKLDHQQCAPEYMEALGKKFGKAFRKLHENNILINDQILTDDVGKSHMIIDTNGEVRFVDFGASIDVTDYPNISDEAVLSLIRTDPFMAFRLQGINFNSKQEKEELIKEYRYNMLSEIETKEDLLKKDTQLLNEGFYFLNDRLPNVNFFIKGIKS